MARKQVRLKDVAEKAGVAVNTASTILNRRPNSWASKATEQRVFAAAEELGYRPNRAAVALQSGRFHTIGLLIADMLNPYFTHFASVMGAQLEERGYKLVIENWRTDLDRERQLLEDFVHQNVDGVAAFLSDVGEYRGFLENQRKLGFPLVVFGMPGADDAAVDLVMPNFETGLREAAKSLFELGHRKFVFLAAKSEGQRVGRRPAIFEEIVRAMEGCSIKVVDCGPSVEEARKVGKNTLEGADRPSVVMSLNDLTAIGVMRAARDLGLDVPGDLSVVGIDGVPLSEQLWVSLSTVQQPHEEMISKAVEFLVQRIEGEGDQPVQRAEFPTHFVQRESVGPAR